MKLLDCCLDLLYPPRCVFCDALLQEGEVYFFMIVLVCSASVILTA